MLWPYAPLGRADRGPARIDRWLPRGARKLEHHGVDLPVPPEIALTTIARLRPNELGAVRTLLWLRGIGSLGDTSLAEAFSTAPFLDLDREPGREWVFGALGSFWHVRRDRFPAPAHTPEQFRAALAAGRMAAIGNWRADPSPDGCRLWTETWAYTPGPVQAAGFAGYWLAIAVFSAWIRREFLAAVRREVSQPGP